MNNHPRYKFIETEGCTAFDRTINGKSLVDISHEEQEEIINYLLTQLKAGINDGTISLFDVIRVFQYDEYGHDDNVCDTCGDTVSWTEWNI